MIGFFWHFFIIIVNCNSSHIELLLDDVCLMKLYEQSLTDCYSRIHECTDFYNRHAAGIDVTVSNSSSVLLCCHGNASVNIRCRGSKYLLSRCLVKMTSASAIIPAFRQCLPSRCVAIVIFCHNIK
jgi:hypothetical protein